MCIFSGNSKTRVGMSTPSLNWVTHNSSECICADLESKIFWIPCWGILRILSAVCWRTTWYLDLRALNVMTSLYLLQRPSHFLYVTLLNCPLSSQKYEKDKENHCSFISSCFPALFSSLSVSFTLSPPPPPPSTPLLCPSTSLFFHLPFHCPLSSFFQEAWRLTTKFS